MLVITHQQNTGVEKLTSFHMFYKYFTIMYSVCFVMYFVEISEQVLQIQCPKASKIQMRI